MQESEGPSFIPRAEDGTNDKDVPAPDGSGQESVTPQAAGDTKRDRSTIQFPYGDLDDAVAVATAVFSLGGHCGLDQLAHKLGHQTVNSGGFQGKVTAALIFKVAEKDKQTVRITDLGQRIIQPELAAQAKVEAFLGVPLYRRVFDNYRGNILPPDSGLENFIKSVGVAEKVADRARQTLQRSALQAGFFSHGSRNKLIVPVGCSENGGPIGSGVSYVPSGEPKTQEELQMEVLNLQRQLQEAKSVQGRNVSMPELPDAIVGVLTTLPLGKDELWTAEDLAEWTQMFEVVIKRAFRDKIQKPTVPAATVQPQTS